jgi:hypothetical protein
MSTPETGTAIVNSAVTTVSTWVTNWETLIKAHEKIIIVGILALTSFFMFDKAVVVWDKHTSAAATQTATAVKTDDTAAKAQALQLQLLRQQVATQSALINKEIAQRNQATTTQQIADKTLPPSALAARWQTLIKVAGVTANGVVDPVTGAQFTVTDQAAVATVVQLESVPTLTANIQSLQTELTNDESIINEQTDLIQDLNKEVTDEKVNTVAQVAAQKAKDAKSKSLWIKIALIGGAVLGGLIGHGI